MSGTVDGLKVVATIEIDVELGGMSQDEFVEGLNRRLGQAVGNGVLTGESPAEVDRWALQIDAQGPAESGLSEEDVEQWFQGLMESGAMRLEEVPKLLARYALSTRESAKAELAERMGLV